jgi:DNA polymerase-1
MGIVDSEGFIYPDYNAHGTISGRFSSSNPNFQNIPFHLRDMFVPAPGKVFVGADFDQLELRFAAALSGATGYLGVFRRNDVDPHNLTGEMMFGSTFWLANGAPKDRREKGTGNFKKLRDLAKTICFASLYGAAPPKIHEILMRAEDQNGRLLYSQYSIRDVRALHRRWLKASPQFETWWDRELDHWRTNGYAEEPVSGRRRYFYEEDFNAIVNFPVQAGSFAIVAQGMLEMIKQLPFNFNRREGLVNQLHDAVLVQVEEAKAQTACEIITDCLTRKVPDLPVTFTADAHVGYSWAQV